MCFVTSLDCIFPNGCSEARGKVNVCQKARFKAYDVYRRDELVIKRFLLSNLDKQLPHYDLQLSDTLVILRLTQRSYCSPLIDQT
jgi:hypothetical protein